MKVLFILGLVLILAFGFSLGAWVAFYGLKLKHPVSKGLTFLLLGALISFLTFALSIFIVWPGV
ncbi:MAG: hypothetical protein ACOY3H_01915 [Bacillota bacterium]|uniref:Uncharacterized protein n=2 Tax=Carboxydocella TaxID=178898 RepID=A0A1T4ML25_9FIRM|nr:MULTISPECIES: hypothetical protein [Carboxydocella]AVX21367.1 hypothetical protein CFE_2224 [Carboxydocella thermautotrophica]AVX31865.1 hypothetical protein CTH_2326 [Carboxydocella thermautotrophica]SJZ67448.1 hypothetical protein SAMN02745885_00634 [Carboxydocella sporoproducens DSM 16521]GAW28535.1 hypothetical protein ULO1_11050 [Carboxydocella sp. ULO1]GAW32402.1 hypothetical protein JDF658_21670 [Carboxydocella sp. JDF658]